MTLGDINSRISFLTNASVTDYTYKDRTINVNKWQQQVFDWILQSQDEWDIDDKNNSDFGIATTSLVANQQDYPLPTGIIKVKRLEISYDGTNWYKATPFDTGERSEPLDSTSLTADFSTSKPYYDIFQNSIFLYPTPTANSSAGLKIWYDRAFTDFTWTSEASNELLTGTKTPGFDSMFHDILALGAAHEFKYHRLKDNSLLNEIMMMKNDLTLHYSNKQKDRQFVMKSSYVNYD